MYATVSYNDSDAHTSTPRPGQECFRNSPEDDHMKEGDINPVREKLCDVVISVSLSAV